MCGIFGVSLKPKLAKGELKNALSNFKILGLYNVSRGKDACGVLVNNSIVKGYGTNKLFQDLLKTDVLEIPRNSPILIGHTRASNKGPYEDATTHPFIVNDDLVGVHNGTIWNIDTLAKENEIKPSEYKVDSHALYQIIYKNGTDVLNKYKGYAALAFTYTKDNLDNLYLYHGASKTYLNGKVEEERPLFILELSNGLYFSSLEESLLAIKEDESQKISVLPHNELYHISSGKIVSVVSKFKRDELVNTQHENFTNTTNNRSTTQHQAIGMKKGSSEVGITNLIEPNFLRETVPSDILYHRKDGPRRIYNHCNRYYITPRVLAHGAFTALRQTGFIAPDSVDILSNPAYDTYYFYEGVLLKTKKAYETLLELEKNPNTFLHKSKEETGQSSTNNFAMCMSTYSKDPVTNLIHQSKGYTPYYRFKYYKDGTLFNGTYTPMFSRRTYTFKDSRLVDITSIVNESLLYSDYQTAIKEYAKIAEEKYLILRGGEGGNNPNRFPESRLSIIKNICSATKSVSELNKDTLRILPSDSESLNSVYKSSFSVTHDNMFDFVRSLNTVEAMTLRNFSTKYLLDGQYLVPDDVEIVQQMKDFMKNCCNFGMSLLEYLKPDKKDLELLINTFDEVSKLNEKSEISIDDVDSVVVDFFTNPNENFMQEEIIVNTNDENVIDLNSEEELEDISAREDILDDILDNTATLYNTAVELTEDDDLSKDDLSQDLAHAIFINGGRLVDDLSKVLEKHGRSQEIKRLSAVKQKINNYTV